MMKTLNGLIKFYEFNDLNEDIQEKLLDEYRDFELDFFNERCEDDFENYWIEQLSIIGFESAKLESYEIEGNRGNDHVFFTADIDLLKLIDYQINHYSLTNEKNRYHKYKRLLTMFNECVFNEIEIGINFSQGHWPYNQHAEIELYDSPSSDYKRINWILESLVEDIQDIYSDYCSKIQDSFQSGYEWLTSDECIIESINCNYTYFDENGNCIDELYESMKTDIYQDKHLYQGRLYDLNFESNSI